MKKYLYGASVQGIQEYIFATNELKSIVGASNIVKNINARIEEEYKKNIIINAAANVKLIFNEKNEFEDLVKNFIKETTQAAHGLKVSQAVVEFESGELNKALQTLEQKLSMQKNRDSLPVDLSLNIVKNAKKTAKPAVENGKDKASLQKEAASLESADMPKNSKNKLAVVHADGNNLGAMIASMTKNLSSDDEIIAKYKSFSTNLELATTAAYESAKEGLKNIRQIVKGGDDVTVVCSADDALEFTERFLKAFEEETEKLFKNGGLTACAGIAYAHYKYPFHYAVDLADSLCSYAKEHSRKVMQRENLKISPSSLMFHNIQSANFNNYKEYIKNELTLENKTQKVFLNFGPYFVRKQKEYSTIESFRHLCGALAQKGSPLTRYREWLTILGQDDKQAQKRLERIDMMLDLRRDVYRKDIFTRCLAKVHAGLNSNTMLITRDGELHTPLYDANVFLSVVSNAIQNGKDEDEI